MITTVCYKQKKTFKTRKEAEDFFLEGMMCSGGSEHERYSSIYEQLKAGKDYCTDEEYVNGLMKGDLE